MPKDNETKRNDWVFFAAFSVSTFLTIDHEHGATSSMVLKYEVFININAGMCYRSQLAFPKDKAEPLPRPSRREYSRLFRQGNAAFFSRSVSLPLMARSLLRTTHHHKKPLFRSKLL
jgi:hypothetical protein